MSAQLELLIRAKSEFDSAFKQLQQNLEQTKGKARTLGPEFDSLGAKGGHLADSVGRVSTTLARSADSFGLPVGPLRALDDVMDVAELGFKNLSSSAAGFNAASAGVVGAGLAIGTAIGTMLRQIPAVSAAADRAAESLFKMFGRTFDRGTEISREEAIRKQVDWMRRQGQTAEQIAGFYGGKLNPALAESLGINLKQIKAHKDAEAQAKKVREEFQKLVEQLSGKTAQAEVDRLAQAFARLGAEGVGNVDALRERLEGLQRQGAKITDEGLLGVLASGKKWPIFEQLEDLPETVERLDTALGPPQEQFDQIAIAADAAGMSTEEVRDALIAAGASGSQLERALGRIPQSFGRDMRQALSQLAPVIMNTLQGGGDVGRAVGGHLGGSIGSSVGRSIAPALTSALGSTVGGALGSVLPGIGTVLGAGLGGMVTNLFGGGAQRQILNQIRDMRNEFVDAAGGIGVLQERAREAGISLDAMFNADSVEEYEFAVANVQKALAGQERATEAITDAMERYGLTVDQMGPRFAQQQLDEQAAQLIQDFRVLTAAGADTNAVLGGMSESVNAYIQSSIAAGTSVPEAMRPMLESMVANGQLLDANGEAYGSLEEAGVTFAQTMTAQFADLMSSIQDLVDAISGTGRAWDDAGSRVDDYRRKVDMIGGPGGGPPEGPFGPEGPPEEFARGGVVLPFVPRAARGIVVPSGPGGSLVRMGEGGEPELAAPVRAILENAVRIGAAAAARGGGGGAIELHVHLDGRDVAYSVERRTNAGQMSLRRRIRR